VDLNCTRNNASSYNTANWQLSAKECNKNKKNNDPAIKAKTVSMHKSQYLKQYSTVNNAGQNAHLHFFN